MKDIEYTITGLYLSLMLCMAECFYFVFTMGKKLNVEGDIVIALFLLNIIGCILAVRVLKINSLSIIIDKYL